MRKGIKDLFDINKVNMQEMRLMSHSAALKTQVHEKVPLSKCLGCPIKGGVGHEVVAECCRKASPPLYFVEFIHAYQHILQTWKKDRVKEMIFKCYEAVLNNNHSKPCVLLDQETNACSIYSHRWTNCRTYGMIPDDEWIDRAKTWVAEVTAERFISKQVVKEKVETGLKGIDGTPIMREIEVEKDAVDQEKQNAYIDELFGTDFNPEKINARLAQDFDIKNLIYKQCKNLAVESNNIDLNSIYKKLARIESNFLEYDITKDEQNSSYLAFHIYVLLFIVGEEAVEFLVRARTKWTDDQKQDFLENIIKKNLDKIVDG